MIIGREALRILTEAAVMAYQQYGINTLLYAQSVIDSYYAAANPETIIVLLDELEAAERERDMLQDIQLERDAAVDFAQDTAERRLTLLKELEWGAEYKTTTTPVGIWWQDCPICGKRNNKGHASDCALAAELAGQV